MIDLMERENDGLKVTLYWDKESDAFYVEVKDKKEDTEFIIPAKPEECTEVFNHPYAYRTPEFVPNIWEGEYNG